MGERSYLAIGDVLALLREEFPDVTISKIRFLESRGLLDPERTPSGYRKFYEPDVDRLRWILRQQREHFLPLKVIKGRLENGMTRPGRAGAPPVRDGRPAAGTRGRAGSGRCCRDRRHRPRECPGGAGGAGTDGRGRLLGRWSAERRAGADRPWRGVRPGGPRRRAGVADQDATATGHGEPPRRPAPRFEAPGRARRHRQSRSPASRRAGAPSRTRESQMPARRSWPASRPSRRPGGRVPTSRRAGPSAPRRARRPGCPVPGSRGRASPLPSSRAPAASRWQASRSSRASGSSQAARWRACTAMTRTPSSSPSSPPASRPMASRPGISGLQARRRPPDRALRPSRHAAAAAAEPRGTSACDRGALRARRARRSAHAVLLPSDASRADRGVSQPQEPVRTLLDADELAAIARRLGGEIAARLSRRRRARRPFEGSVCFLADLVRELPGPLRARLPRPFVLRRRPHAGARRQGPRPRGSRPRRRRRA